MPTLPTVQEVPKDIKCEHEFHMRVRKSMFIAFELFWNDFDGQLTAKGIDNLSTDTMAEAARRIGLRAPGGKPTEDLIRSLLRQILNAHDAALVDDGPRASSTASAIEQAMTAAQLHGHPVLLVLPAG